MVVADFDWSKIPIVAIAQQGMTVGIASQCGTHEVNVAYTFTHRKLPPLALADNFLYLWRKTPFNQARRVAGYHCKIRHVLGYNASRPDNGAKTNASATGGDDY